MVQELLRSKISPPRLRRATVSRRRLGALLDAGVGENLVLVCAPAGYGKSTLVAEWLAGRSEDLYAAWLSLDAADNDAGRFVAYLAACAADQAERHGLAQALYALGLPLLSLL